MDEIITTCVQQQNRIFESHEEFRSDVQRFMRLAKVKESHLVVFPELSGLLLAPPLAPGLKRTLLRVAERQVKKKSSLFDRMIGRAANSAADVMGGISKSLTDAIIEHESTLRDAYLTIFSDIAREYGMYVIGGSLYLPDSRDGQLHNTAYLFGPGGEIVGQQSKVNLGAIDRQYCQPAIDGLHALETDFGKLGILIGQDVLFPESGRILADNGALFVANLLAATDSLTFLKAREALAARVQENLLLGAQSCLVGKSILGQSMGNYVGKSSIIAPLELTTRYSGTLGEVGTTISESVISATWDLKGLYELRNTMDTLTWLIPDNPALQLQLRALYAPSAEGDTIAPALTHPPTEMILTGETSGPTFEEEQPEATAIPLPPPEEMLETSDAAADQEETGTEAEVIEELAGSSPALEATGEAELETESLVGEGETSPFALDSPEQLPDASSDSWSWPSELTGEDEPATKTIREEEETPAPEQEQDLGSNRFWWTDQDVEDQGEISPVIDMDTPDSVLDMWEDTLAPTAESETEGDTSTHAAEAGGFGKPWDDEDESSAENPLISTLSTQEQTDPEIEAEISADDVPDATESGIPLQDSPEEGIEGPAGDAPDDDSNDGPSIGRFRSWLRR